MALNPSGPMSIGGSIVGQSINLELGLAADANSSIGQANFRELAKIPSGVISLSDFYGKSNVTTIEITENRTQYVLSPAVVPDYVAGGTKVQLNIGEDVYLYATNTSVAALTITGFVSGDEVLIVNEGYILGMGGQGGLIDSYPQYGYGVAGGPAISLGFNATIENNRYICGGGGGGSMDFNFDGGGGGAGGGKGGNAGYAPLLGNDGGLGGAPGMAGGNGRSPQAGGGGGRIVPGIGGLGGVLDSGEGKGGGAGGGGAAAAQEEYIADGGAGGTGGSPGNTGGLPTWGGAGGGGWGATGGKSYYPSDNHGGKAIALNGYTVTRYGPGFYYGAVS
jgi:hypothetical protein